MITIHPIGYVRSARNQVWDDGWGHVPARIELTNGFDPECLEGLEEFSHAEIVFYFDRVPESSIERGAPHPRGNPAWPRVGIFAQRGKNRPNRLGTTIVKIIRRERRSLTIEGLDAVDGTPVVDIKPVMAEFLPREPVRQPEWSRELMRHYWDSPRG